MAHRGEAGLGLGRGRRLGFQDHRANCFFFSSYKYPWKLEEARKNLLRTHTTSASARALYRLAQKVPVGLGREGGWCCLIDLLTLARAGPGPAVIPPPQKPFTPAKYFSIDRVFRNETLDATHLAEFHQIEGVIADHGLTLGHLMGVLKEFFTKLGKQPSQYRQVVSGEPGRVPLGHQPALANPYRNHPIALQASLQPLHRAQHGSIQLPSRSGMRNWVQREV